MRGSGYPTREEAIEAGRLWRDRFTVAFAHFDKGIEIGSDKTPDVSDYSFGQPYFNYNQGREKRDTTKLFVFPTNKEPRWGGLAGEAVVAHAIERFVANPLAWVKARSGWELTDKQQLAYKFVHGSFFEENPESAYILLFTGVEALIPKAFRVDPVKNALRRLRQDLATMTELDESVRDSVDKLLEYKENESIRYRGRNWVQLLGEERFDTKTPEQYFLDAFVTRNQLAHGNVNRPSAEELQKEIPELRRYLLALLDTTVFSELMPLGC